MKGHRWHRLLAAAVCCMVAFGVLPVQAEEVIRHSTVDYDATFYDASQIFIGNEKEVNWEIGKKYFLHYTVTNVVKDDTNQSGMMVTKDPTDAFPYEKGGMHYGDNVSICEEGETYLFRFEVTKTGLKYVAGKANSTSSSYIQFPYAVGELKTKAPYFGVWITGTDGGSLTAEFRNIRCYDEDGNDLGVSIPKASKISPSAMNKLEMRHSYSFSVKNAACLAFGSERYSTSDVITLEYSVSNVKAEGVTQSGAELTNAPTDVYPHGSDNGYLNFDFHDQAKQTKLLTEGADYLVRMERKIGGFDVLVKRTLENGAADYFSFANYAGNMNEKFGYFAMWFGETCKVTADFTNVKCYDKEGNNLAIQTNQGVTVEHHGGLEDYSPCAATYYCEATQTLLTLDKECGATSQTLHTQDTRKGVYSVDHGAMILKLDGETQECVYTYEYVKDQQGNKYFRLRDKKVTFMSKPIGGDVIATVTSDASTDYKIARPEDPTGGNGQFVCWVDGAGQEYDFESIVTESKTLYATWDGEQTWETVASVSESNIPKDVVISVACCLVLTISTVVVNVVLATRKRRNYEEK